MNVAKSEKTPGDTLPRRRLIGVYLAAAVLGYVLGSQGVLPFPESSTPLARVGFALRSESPSASGDAWTALKSDIEQVRLGWSGPDPTAFDLVIAVRGLANGGHPEWVRAEELCHELKWSHCERAALDELARRSRP